MSILLSLKIIPNASSAKIIRRVSGELVCYVTQPAVDNKANEALRRFLASQAEMPLNAVTIETGFKTKKKTVKFVTQLSKEMLLKQLGIEPEQQQVVPSIKNLKF